VTSLPNVVVPPAPVDTVATPVVVPPVVTPPVVVPPVVTPPVVVPPVVVPPADPKNKKDKDQPKKIKIYSSGKKIYIENPGKKGKMKLVHAVTGRTLKTADFCAQGTTIISADVTAGTYMVNGATDSDDETTMVILQ